MLLRRCNGSNNVGDVAWYYNNSGSEAHPVGTKRANALGIYDMCGNIDEWCFDTGELTNPVHNVNGSNSSYYRIYSGGSLRGGIYTIWERNTTHSANTAMNDSNTSFNTIFGLRIARNAE